MKNQINRLKKIIKAVLYCRDKKVFCLSMQKSGTTSVGKFLSDHGYRRAGWRVSQRNSWSQLWYDGRYDKIFSSLDFRAANAFEDSPWFFPGFYEVLYRRFPDAKFILLERDPEAWFRSMQNHFGRYDRLSRIHVTIYDREQEYLKLLAAGKSDQASESRPDPLKTMNFRSQADHYKKLYQDHTREVRCFFRRHSSEALYVGRLEDPDKWQKIGCFLGLDVFEGYDSHVNKTEHHFL